MASFNGVDLGIIEGCKTVASRKERQITAYPRVNGLQIVDMGQRGGESRVRGVLIAADAPTLDGLCQTLRDLQNDGGQYVFVDNVGVAWVDVILEFFDPADARIPGFADGSIGVRYTLDLLHPDD